MNKTATSRQALLEAAREIARRDGLGHISIRRTAAMCGVSVGTVYNYYPAKADLVLAVIEDFWKRVFHGGLSCDFTHGSDFSAVCGQIYTALRNSPFVMGETQSCCTLIAPADWPIRVTWPGSPPKAAILSRTQHSAAIWSNIA